MSAPPASTDGIPTRELPGGVAMPVLGLGVWQLPEGPDAEQAVEWALEAGYRHFDTATYYGNEHSVGAALARSGIPREQLFVTTKWLPIRRGPGSELRRSLERLGLAQVDLYLIHWPLPGRTARGWRELEELADAGLARAVGVSNYGRRRLAGLLGSGARAPAVDQVHFSPLHFPAGLLDFCASRGIVLEAYSPLERGKVVQHPVVLDVARRVQRSPAQVALRWALQHGAIVIPKSGRRERIRENAALFDFELGPEEMRLLDAIDARDGRA